MDKPLKIWLLAGETSGDDIGAKLIAAIKKSQPNVQFYGVGGSKMQAQGQQILFSMQELAVMGFVEVLPKLRKLTNLLRLCKEDITDLHPDVVVTIDSPGFSLRLLKSIRHTGLKRVHYVAPQVWAWHESRVKKFPGLWDKLLCLFPFEQEFFQYHQLPSSFVGNPVIETKPATLNHNELQERFPFLQQKQVILLLPGSRRSELPKLLPIFERTIDRLTLKLPDIAVIIPTSEEIELNVNMLVRSWSLQPLVISSYKDKIDAYELANIALTKSGTSTLELALFSVPMVVTYRVNPLTAVFAKYLIKVPYVSMVNLLAGKEVVPELLQQNCNPTRLADALYAGLTTPSLVEYQRKGFKEIIDKLQAPAPFHSPSDAAAYEILRLI